MYKCLAYIGHWLELRNNVDWKEPVFSLKEECSGSDSLLSNFLFQSLIPEFEKLESINRFRCGILYTCGGHITPIVIELVQSTYHWDERICVNIFNTDSRSFDVHNGRALRSTLISLVQTGFQKKCFVSLYACGLIDTDYHNNKQNVRQHADGYCGLYSLIDLDTMLAQPDLSTYFSKTKEGAHSDFLPEIVDRDIFRHTRLFQIECLPAEMMLYTQSVYGTEDGERVGLSQLYEKNSAPENVNLLSSSLNFVDPINELSSPSDRLRKYLADSSHKHHCSVDIASLFTFIKKNNIPRNFVIDAIGEMYDERAAKLDITVPNKFDITTLSIEELTPLMERKSRVRRKSISPLQSFAYSQPMEALGSFFFEANRTRKESSKPVEAHPELENNRFYRLSSRALRRPSYNFYRPKARREQQDELSVESDSQLKTFI